MANHYDISLDFSLDSKGDISLVEDEKAINQAIRNIIISTSGSKVGLGPINQYYGVGVKGYLFQPLTQFMAESLGGNILRQLTMFEPRIKVTNVNTDVYREKKMIDITVYYYIIKTSKETKFNTIINQL
jgi:phage baseplate assembly protein W